MPHFEKMLYDNAQLLELLALAYQRTGKPLFRQRARETVGWLKREMTTAEGAFSASLDADSEGEEGKFYVWSYAEVMRVLGVEDGEFFARHYDVTPAGNFEGHNILNRLKPQPRSDDDEARLAALRAKLLGVRDARVRPGLDDKVLADWNGLMIAALANAGLLSRRAVLDRHRRARVRLHRARDDARRPARPFLARRPARFPGLASDFAAMIRAALALHEATGRRSYLEQALTWQRALDRDYANAETGSYFLTADDAEGLVVRPPPTTDDATPNPNAVAAQNLIRLALLAGRRWLARKGRPAVRGARAARDREPLHAHGAAQRPRPAAARRGDRGDRRRRRRRGAARRRARAAVSRPHRAARAARRKACRRLIRRRPRSRAAGTAQAFVCIGETCSLPVTDPAGLIAAVESTRRN